MAVALYPGSYDPIHLGHVAVIEIGCRIFDRVIVAVGHNPEKPSGYFAVEERVGMIREVVAPLGKVDVVTFAGLVTVAAADNGADCLVKGVRSNTDADAEMLQANMNAATGGGIPTLFIPGIGPHALVSSRYVREIAGAGGDVSGVVPPAVMSRLRARRSDP
ncbi:MAG: pantetheine-phosphate adenylyltransferase [Acidimicrobiales bacterium]